MLIENPLHQSSLALPLLESLHLAGIVCGVGTAAVMNLRLLRVGMRSRSPALVWRETALLTLGGLTLAVLTGLLLFSIDPELYLENAAFRFKMGALVAALVFYYWIVRRAAARDREAPLAAILSLALFALVPLGGIFIGYS